jgi:hypothetical protein
MIAHIYLSVLQAVSGRGSAGCLDSCFQVYEGEAMHYLGYELRRIPIPRTPVNMPAHRLHAGKTSAGGSRENDPHGWGVSSVRPEPSEFITQILPYPSVPSEFIQNSSASCLMDEL